MKILYGIISILSLLFLGYVTIHEPMLIVAAANIAFKVFALLVIFLAILLILAYFNHKE